MREKVKVTSAERENIEKKSPSRSLPLNPLQRGWSSEQIRLQLSRFVTDKEDSVLALLEEKFDIIDEIILALETDFENRSYSKEETDNKVLNVLQESKAYSDDHFVKKTRRIANIDLEDDITRNELTMALRIATDEASGIMTDIDHRKLTSLWAIFEDADDEFADTLTEILEVFSKYPGGVDIVDKFAGKVDKSPGKSLVRDSEIDKLETVSAYAEPNADIVLKKIGSGNTVVGITLDEENKYKLNVEYGVGVEEAVDDLREEIFSSLLTVEEDVDIDVILKSGADISFIDPVESIVIRIPPAEHGFHAGVNFKIPTEIPTFQIINNSGFPLKYMQYGRVRNNIVLTPNTTVNLSFYSDGINVYCYYMEIL